MSTPKILKNCKKVIDNATELHQARVALSFTQNEDEASQAQAKIQDLQEKAQNLQNEWTNLGQKHCLNSHKYGGEFLTSRDPPKYSTWGQSGGWFNL